MEIFANSVCGEVGLSLLAGAYCELLGRSCAAQVGNQFANGVLEGVDVARWEDPADRIADPLGRADLIARHNGNACGQRLGGDEGERLPVTRSEYGVHLRVQVLHLARMLAGRTAATRPFSSLRWPL